jgi:HD-like signal output (HDOD) protein
MTVVQTCKTTGRPQYEVESELLGVTHAEVGAYLLALWGLPLPIVEAVAFHHNPSAAIEDLFDIPSAVSLANSLVTPADSPANLREHLHSLGVGGQLDKWTAVAREEIEKVNERQLAKTGK